MGGAQTGTGKTAGFTLPILQKLLPMANASPSPARHPVRALILTPTRELAIQVEEAVKTYGKYTGPALDGRLRRRRHQAAAADRSRRHRDPGRHARHGCSITSSRNRLYLGQVEIFVLDEADRMLDMGFIPDIKRIMALLPATAKRQNLLFSATFSNEIKKLADQLLNAPQTDRSREAQHHRRNRVAKRLQGRDRPEARVARAYRHLAQSVAGALFRAHQARRVAPGATAREGRPEDHGDPRRQEPGRRVSKRSTISRPPRCR